MRVALLDSEKCNSCKLQASYLEVKYENTVGKNFARNKKDT